MRGVDMIYQNIREWSAGGYTYTIVQRKWAGLRGRYGATQRCVHAEKRIQDPYIYTYWQTNGALRKEERENGTESPRQYDNLRVSCLVWLGLFSLNSWHRLGLPFLSRVNKIYNTL